MRNCRTRPEKQIALSLAGVISLLTLAASPLHARDLTGQSLTIDATTPLDTYNLSAASVLTVDGAQTGVIQSSQSTLNILSGTTTAPTASAIRLVDSQATIGNATITSTNLTGLLLGRLNIGSTARVTDSQISGGFAGAQASAGSQLIIQRSQVTATTPAGVGLRLLGGSADVSANSVITGQTAGIRMAQESPTVNVPALTLDNSHVVGVNGPAIAVGGGTEATLQVSNGSTLTGNNGVALNLERTSNLAAVVEDSRLVGGVTVAEQALGDLLFDNSQIDGHLQIAGTLDASLDQSTLNGNLNVSELGDASARFTDTAAMNGNIDSAGAAVVSFEQSNLTGNAVVTDTGTLNLSFSEGSMTGNIESAGTATATFSQSTLTGDAVAATGGTLNLTMTDGRMDGNIDSAG
ncbi:right-handed parallel beta-helix repeat-containing protein, partial [Pseudomonas urmiensis]|uniref:right-handed parallel beta-helix repeat-containing protein n=1 Tax=Pseudomonas urmiensis TaxID=2745493 RepID=UPI003D0F9040